MMKLTLALMILPLLACTVPGHADDNAGREQDIPGPGRHRLTFDLGQERSIRCSISMPEQPRQGKPPLVLALHYGGEMTPWVSMPFLEMLPGPAFEPLGAIIIAPDCPGRDWNDSRSEEAVLALVRLALGYWGADPARVVVTGFSMGGMGTWHMAARHPEIFCAAMPVAGGPADAPPVKIPLYAICSRRDEIVAIDPIKKAVKEMKKRGIHAKLVVLKDGPTHYDTAGFAPTLRRGTKWLRQLWEKKAEAPPPGKE